MMHETKRVNKKRGAFYNKDIYLRIFSNYLNLSGISINCYDIYRKYCGSSLKHSGSSQKLSGSSLNLSGSSLNLSGSSLNLSGSSLKVSGNYLNGSSSNSTFKYRKVSESDIRLYF
jgi:hypothetical protein